MPNLKFLVFVNTLNESNRNACRFRAEDTEISVCHKQAHPLHTTPQTSLIVIFEKIRKPGPEEGESKHSLQDKLKHVHLRGVWNELGKFWEFRGEKSLSFQTRRNYIWQTVHKILWLKLSTRLPSKTRSWLQISLKCFEIFRPVPDDLFCNFRNRKWYKVTQLVAKWGW